MIYDSLFETMKQIEIDNPDGVHSETRDFREKFFEDEHNVVVWLKVTDEWCKDNRAARTRSKLLQAWKEGQLI